MAGGSSGAGAPKPVALDSIPHPSRTSMLGETYYPHNSTSYEKNGQGYGYFDTTGGALMRDRHLGGSNYAYLDGHVKWVKKEAVDAMLAEQLAEKGINGLARNGGGLIESLGKWQEFPIVFGWAVE